MIKISAKVKNSGGNHQVTLKTMDNEHSIAVAPKASGFGSSVNGGEMLFLALATCYCNDIYREAAKKNITVTNVEIAVEGEFDPAPGSIAENVVYHATVEADAPQDVIEDLLRHTDTVAEVQNTLRNGVSVKLDSVKGVLKE